MDIETKIESAAKLVRRAQHMIAFTGAGHSTPSGIPDFRSPGSGAWEKDDPMAVASIWAFRTHPENFFRWIRPLADTLLDATPNPAHTALAELEARGTLKTVITQNIDDLHQKAGSERVLELHGHLREATCIRCYQTVAVDTDLQQVVREGQVPRCECGGVLKPNVILFGEQLPIHILNEALQEARRCDLVLVAGSSLSVPPAAEIPYVAVDSGARAIMVNLQPTAFDRWADVTIQGDVAKVLPRLVEAI